MPAEHRGHSLTCYMPSRVIQRLEEIAEDRRTTRNKLMAHVLAEFVDGVDRNRQPDGPARDTATEQLR